jgi:hypothetical protein
LKNVGAEKWEGRGEPPSSGELEAARAAIAERGLSMVHISPATVEVWAGGGVLKVTAEHTPHVTVPDRRPKSKRGKVRGLSSASRWRMIIKLREVLLSALPIFVTLTYADGWSEDPKVWKRDIDSFWKRVHRRFPKVGGIWRMEMKARKSGKQVGELAPHYHAMLWGLPWPENGTARAALILWVKMAWYEVVGSEDEAHKKAGTRVEKINSPKHAMFYLCKYMSKADEVEAIEVGRMWGVRYKVNIPWAAHLVFDCSKAFAFSLMRAMRRFMKLSKSFAFHSLRCLCDASQWAQKFGLSPPELLRQAERIAAGLAV